MASEERFNHFGKMKKQEQKQIISLDEFDSTVSLYQLIPSGAGRAISNLKLIIDSIHNSQIEQSLKPISLLITGKQGVRTHARSFIRALGLEFINESPSHLLQATPTAVSDFFDPLLTCDSYLISDVNLLNSSILKILYQIMTCGKYSLNNHFNQSKEIIAVYHPLVMTARNNKIPHYFTEKIDHIIEIEEYNDQQLELVVLQRLKYCQVSYENEKVLELLVAYGHKDLHKIIRLLKSSITVMLAGSRKVLTVADIKKVMAYS